MSAKYHETVRENQDKEISGEYTTHTTTHVIVSNGGIFIGIAECGDSDEYRKKTGKEIALGRAEKAMAIAYGWIDDVDVDVDGFFKYVSILSPSGDLVEGRIWVPAEEELEDDSVEVPEVVARC